MHVRQFLTVQLSTQEQQSSIQRSNMQPSREVEGDHWITTR